MVFVSHLDFLKQSTSEVLKWLYDNLFYEGYIGVSFFFILSSFVLAYTYQDQILKNKISSRAFYMARFARIYPLHFLTLIISIPLTFSIFIQNKTLWIIQLITNLTLTQSYIPNRHIYFSFNAPSWSISDEMFYYLVFPFLIIWIAKSDHYKNVLFLLIIAIIPLLTLIITQRYYHHIFYIHPFARLVDFMIGIFLFNFYHKFSKKERRINYTYLEISAILLLLFFFWLHQSIPPVARYSFYYWLPMTFLIFAFSFQKGKISKILSQ
jgi:peptidoglycan/LPS O-acetylase OafA/YrhL